MEFENFDNQSAAFANTSHMTPFMGYNASVCFPDHSSNSAGYGNQGYGPAFNTQNTSSNIFPCSQSYSYQTQPLFQSGFEGQKSSQSSFQQGNSNTNFGFTSGPLSMFNNENANPNSFQPMGSVDFNMKKGAPEMNLTSGLMGNKEEPVKRALRPRKPRAENLFLNKTGYDEDEAEDEDFNVNEAAAQEEDESDSDEWVDENEINEGI
jgi:hypothetical protein